jgi:hypothetical protein
VTGTVRLNIGRRALRLLSADDTPRFRREQLSTGKEANQGRGALGGAALDVTY